MRRIATCLLFLAATTGFANSASAASITFDLNCLIQNGPCTPSGSFGTIVISDSHASLAAGAGDLHITVDVIGAGKFRDLMLNFTGSAARLTSADGQVLLAPNSFVLTPYFGSFDVGATDSQGWNTTSEPYTTILYGWAATGSTAASATAGASSVPLLLSDFLALDTGNQVYGAIHLQNLNCQIAPCPQGYTSDSIKVGATFDDGENEIQQVPEPASMALIGVGLAAAATRLRRRR
jgi:hypothetical protein